MSMNRVLYDPKNTRQLSGLAPVSLGGTSASTVQEAQANLQIIPAVELDKASGVAQLDSRAKIKITNLKTGPGGVVLLDATGKLPRGMMPVGYVSIEGPTTGKINTVLSYTITDYDAYTDYILTTQHGSLARTEATLTFTPNALGKCVFSVNDKLVTITVTP